MRIQIASDLHLEMRSGNLPPPAVFTPALERDVLVLAGDIGANMNALEFVESQARLSPVIYVPGNHEYYCRRPRYRVDAAWRRVSRRTRNLFFLVGEGATIDGVRFWGAPWYSDLFGRRDREFRRWIGGCHKDFRRPFGGLGRWSVKRHVKAHARQTDLLREQAGRVDVVITHWPPVKSAARAYMRDGGTDAYYVNDQEDLVREIGAKLWISGHVHCPHDRMVGGTRCASNPAGYPGEMLAAEGFLPERIVEV